MTSIFKDTAFGIRFNSVKLSNFKIVFKNH